MSIAAVDDLTKRYNEQLAAAENDDTEEEKHETPFLLLGGGRRTAVPYSREQLTSDHRREREDMLKTHMLETEEGELSLLRKKVTMADTAAIHYEGIDQNIAAPPNDREARMMLSAMESSLERTLAENEWERDRMNEEYDTLKRKREELPEEDDDEVLKRCKRSIGLSSPAKFSSNNKNKAASDVMGVRRYSSGVCIVFHSGKEVSNASPTGSFYRYAIYCGSNSRGSLKRSTRYVINRTMSVHPDLHPAFVVFGCDSGKAMRDLLVRSRSFAEASPMTLVASNKQHTREQHKTSRQEARTSMGVDELCRYVVDNIGYGVRVVTVNGWRLYTPSSGGGEDVSAAVAVTESERDLLGYILRTSIKAKTPEVLSRLNREMCISPECNKTREV